MIQLIRAYMARRQVRAMFGDSLAPELLNQMIAEGGKSPASAQPADVELTPFFASIHGYVGLAEQLDTTQLRELMNRYFDACGTEIQNERGSIEKFIGDAIVAMFGAPQPLPGHALHACIVALRCQTRVAKLREHLRREGATWPERARQLRIRIGLHTGTVLVGNMGPPDRPAYTMMGDNVNLAARLEAEAKTYGVWTLCSDATRQQCEQADPGRIFFRPLGPIVIKGRAAPIELFEPMALRDDVTAQMRECVDHFTAGLGRLSAQNWTGAIACFEQSARLERDQPGTSPEIERNPSTYYLELAQSCRTANSKA